MPKPNVRAGGGLHAVRYSLRKSREAGGLFKLYRRLRSRNACKTCAFGMGGQRGGMVNEQGTFPEANVLVPRRVDPASGTPAFKSIAARIVK